MNSHADPASVSSAPAPLRLIRAALVADGAGVQHAPGALLLRGGAVVATGAPQEVGEPAEAVVETHADSAVLPAFVNAHTHLDLTFMGCRPYGGEFDPWLADVLAARRTMTPDSTDASVQQGVTALLRGGVAAVGDIAGHLAPTPSLQRLAAGGIGGVSFTEIFGMGRGRTSAMAAVAATTAQAAEEAVPSPYGLELQRGLQPHAPYSSDPAVFLASLRSGLPTCTHLAESPEETEFLRFGTGRFRRFLTEIKLWDDSVVLGARHPVDWLAAILAQAGAGTRTAAGHRILCAHCNMLDDAALETLVAAPIDVAYCPRASAYFGHTGHRYRELLARGVDVALGTDSIICLDTPDRLSTLDDARFLMRRDALPLATALAMGTVHGARALGLPAGRFTFAPSHIPPAGILRVPLDPNSGGIPTTVIQATAAFAASRSAPQWLARA